MGEKFGTSSTVQEIRTAIKNGLISRGKKLILTGNQRLDVVALDEYGDGRYWWIIAAASDIGWGMQVPPGTILYVPLLNDVLRFVALCQLLIR